MLHNKIFTVSKFLPEHHNLPPNYDVLFMPLPDTTDYEDTGFTLTYKGMIVDYGTGTYADFLLAPKAVSAYDCAMTVFTREQYNELLDFVFTVEGRYLNFWTPSLMEQFIAVAFVPERFGSDLEGLDHIGGTTPDTERVMYVLDWGQMEEWKKSKRLILIFTDGYKHCYWCKLEKIERTSDFRILKLTFVDPLPNIAIADIDMISDALYMRMGVDEVQFDAITSVIHNCFFAMVEDTANYYDPWTELPPIYPQMPEAPPAEEEPTNG